MKNLRSFEQINIDWNKVALEGECYNDFLNDCYYQFDNSGWTGNCFKAETRDELSKMVIQCILEPDLKQENELNIINWTGKGFYDYNSFTGEVTRIDVVLKDILEGILEEFYNKEDPEEDDTINIEEFYNTFGYGKEVEEVLGNNKENIEDGEEVNAVVENNKEDEEVVNTVVESNKQVLTKKFENKTDEYEIYFDRLTKEQIEKAKSFIENFKNDYIIKTKEIIFYYNKNEYKELLETLNIRHCWDRYYKNLIVIKFEAIFNLDNFNVDLNIIEDEQHLQEETQEEINEAFGDLELELKEYIKYEDDFEF